MKQADNNEIELLLRSLAKQKGIGSLSDDAMSEARVNEMHLDADELNSYAEGVLPALTRARYTAHLADCARCRGIVTQLTLETGASDRQKQIEHLTRVTFWQKLGVFFSPPVLRYAIPAFAVFAVIAVGVVALRQQGPTEFVAQNQRTASRVDSTETTPTELKGSQENNAPATTADQPLAKSSNAVLPADKGKKGNNTKSEVAQAQAAGSADSVSVDSRKESPESAVAANAPARPSYATEPAAAPSTARPQTTLADSAKTEIAGKEKSSETETLSGQREDAKTRAKDEAAENRVAVAKRQAGSAAGRKVEGNRDEEARPGVGTGGRLEKQAENETQARTVAGRRFRRQGNVWIDTAYESSRPIINVARGSEQYRALVADEPSIRTIAEQLSGEVIAVWKGRVYRLY